jgi:hypothetical protein
MPTTRVATAAILALSISAAAQQPGLRLYAPLGPFETQLVDGLGNQVHSWPGTGTTSCYLRPNGNLIRGMVEPNLGIPGTTGRLQEMNIEGTISWDCVVSDAQKLMHHDIEILPNGNILIIAADRQTPADAIAAGRDPSLIAGAVWLPDSVLELERTGLNTYNVVWEWHIKDHYVQDFDVTKPNFGVVANEPGKVDINFPPVVVNTVYYNHMNGIDYDPINDWIVVSTRNQQEIWLIDHSTTTAESAGSTGGARGKGGDLLWRWGNPQAYDHGGPADQQLHRQHDPRFIPPGFPGAGNLTMFDNDHIIGPTNQSAVYEIELPVDGTGMPFIDPVIGQYGPAAPLWIYTDPSFYSAFVSSAERLANGNTLICSGQQSYLFEIDPSGTVVWSFNPPGAPFVYQIQNVDRRLWANGDEMSVAGGRIEFTNLVDSSHAGDMFFLLGSLSGTSPGTLMPGGVVVPLNIDVLMTGMALYPNIGVFQNTMGMFDPSGKEVSALDIPPGLISPALVGLEMDFAHLILQGGITTEVSNTVRVDIIN